MQTDPSQSKSTQELLMEWRNLHPEYSDEEWDYAVAEMKEYIKIAWEIYRQKHANLDLPETL